MIILTCETMMEFVVLIFLQFYSMSSYQSLADIASNKAEGVEDPSLSSGKKNTQYMLLFKKKMLKHEK